MQFAGPNHLITPGSLVIAILLLAGTTSLASEQGAEVWLDRMNEAVEFLNYEGTLVYMQPGKVDMFRIYHRVDGSEIAERIVEMDGVGAEIIRTSNEIICIFPAQQSVVVGRRIGQRYNQNPLRANLPEYSASLASQYRLEVLSPERVADRLATVIAIKPRDEYRYGYRLWLDGETAMPLKSQLIGENEEMPIEEIRFSTISMPELVDKELVRSSRDASGYTWLRHSDGPEQDRPENEIRWRTEALPAGFMQSAAMHEYMENSAEPRVHLVYSDGLASVSVFVDIGVAASEQVEGVSMIGAANAYSVMKHGMLVTAIGEVPPQTVQQIAQSTVMLE